MADALNCKFATGVCLTDGDLGFTEEDSISSASPGNAASTSVHCDFPLVKDHHGFIDEREVDFVLLNLNEFNK